MRMVDRIINCLKKEENGSKAMALVKRVVILLPCFQIRKDTIISPKHKIQPTLWYLDLSMKRSYMMATRIIMVNVNSGK